MTATVLFTNLDQEWGYLVRSDAMAAALSEWARTDEVLRPFPTLADLEAAATSWDPSSASDAVLSALLARAGSDRRAARAVLQFMLPVLKAMVRRYSFAFESVEDCAQEVVAVALERIANYPWQRWPSWRRYVVRNLARDIRHALCHRQVAPERRLDVDADVDWGRLEERVAEPTPEQTPAGRLRGLLDAAVARGHITEAQAEVVARTRIEGASLLEVAADRGCTAEAAGCVRRRAERKLGLGPRPARRHIGLRAELDAALERGDITEAQAEVVARTRIDGATLAEVAAAAGRSVQAIHRRRSRAERALGLDAA